MARPPSTDRLEVRERRCPRVVLEKEDREQAKSPNSIPASHNRARSVRTPTAVPRTTEKTVTIHGRRLVGR